MQDAYMRRGTIALIPGPWLTKIDAAGQLRGGLCSYGQWVGRISLGMVGQCKCSRRKILLCSSSPMNLCHDPLVSSSALLARRLSSWLCNKVSDQSLVRMRAVDISKRPCSLATREEGDREQVVSSSVPHVAPETAVGEATSHGSLDFD